MRCLPKINYQGSDSGQVRLFSTSDTFHARGLDPISGKDVSKLLKSILRDLFTKKSELITEKRFGVNLYPLTEEAVNYLCLHKERENSVDC